MTAGIAGKWVISPTGIRILLPPPTIDRETLLCFSLSPGVARATVVSLNIRIDPRNGAGRLAHVLGLAVTILDLMRAPGQADCNRAQCLGCYSSATVKATLEQMGLMKKEIPLFRTFPSP